MNVRKVQSVQINSFVFMLGVFGAHELFQINSHFCPVFCPLPLIFLPSNFAPFFALFHICPIFCPHFLPLPLPSTQKEGKGKGKKRGQNIGQMRKRAKKRAKPDTTRMPKSIMHADLLCIYLPESGHLTHKDPIMGSYNNRVYKCNSLEQEQLEVLCFICFLLFQDEVALCPPKIVNVYWLFF